MISFVILTIVAVEHLIFGYIEIFGSREMQSKVFDIELKELDSPLFCSALANQGIYNISFGILVLFFIIINAPLLVLIGMMVFVVLVGIYGAYTVSKKILIVQALPAILGILSLIFL